MRGEGGEEVEDDERAGNDIADNDIPEEFLKVIRYLQIFERPEGLTRKKYLQFQRFATKFLLCDGVLYRRSKPNIPPKRVICNLDERNCIASCMTNLAIEEDRELIPRLR